MRRFGPIAAALVLLAALAGTAAAASSPLVPPFIQRLVEAKAGPLAYAPTRVPFRYGYVSYKWDGSHRMLTLRFADRRFPLDGRHTLAVTARPFAGSCAAGKQKTLQMGGNKVYWDGAVAWRCVRSPAGGNVKLSAAGPNLPDVGLGRVAASVKHL